MPGSGYPLAIDEMEDRVGGGALTVMGEAIEALERKLGVGSTSPSSGKVLVGLPGGVTAWQESSGGSASVWHDVTAFGAEGDGTTDDTAAIVAALAALPPTGGTVVLPEGTYKVTSTITFPSYARIVGMGSCATTILWAGGATDYVFDASSVTSGAIRDLRIVGSSSGYGMLFDLAFSFRLDDVRFVGLSRGVRFANNAGDTLLTNCAFLSCAVGIVVDSTTNFMVGGQFADCATGVAQSGNGGGFRFSSVSFGGTGAARHVDLDQGGVFSFVQCWFEASTASCARLGNGTDAGPWSTVFDACHFHTTGDHSLDLRAGGFGTLVSGCTFDAPADVAIASGHYRAMLVGNRSLVGESVAVTNGNGDALVVSQDTNQLVELSTIPVQGGSSTTPLVIQGTRASGGAGVDFRTKVSGGSQASFMYSYAGAAGPMVVFPGTMYIEGPVAMQGSSTVGFFGATPGSKPTVTGSRGSNAALASLLTALAGLGLVTDSSS